MANVAKTAICSCERNPWCVSTRHRCYGRGTPQQMLTGPDERSSGSSLFQNVVQKQEKTPGAWTRSSHGSCDPPDVFLNPISLTRRAGCPVAASLATLGCDNTFPRLPRPALPPTTTPPPEGSAAEPQPIRRSTRPALSLKTPPFRHEAFTPTRSDLRPAAFFLSSSI